MLQASLDLRAEVEEFHAFLKGLGADDWKRPTGFKGWTPWDVVAHLHFYDDVSVLALTDVDAFMAKRDALIVDITSGMGNADIARRRSAHTIASEGDGSRSGFVITDSSLHRHVSPRAHRIFVTDVRFSSTGVGGLPRGPRFHCWPSGVGFVGAPPTI